MGMGFPPKTAEMRQTDALEEIVQVLRSINDKLPVSVPGEILELDAPPQAVVDQIPVMMFGSDELIGRAQVTEDNVVHFEVRGGDLTTIVKNLISLNQVVAFQLGITYQNEAVTRG